ncbi:hypothetical protein D3C84_767580 [compost metagenome]
MGERAAEKQCGFSAVDEHRVGDLAVQEERLAHVIEQHEQDHQSPEGIDGHQALAYAGDGWDLNEVCHRKSQAGSGLLCR